MEHDPIALLGADHEAMRTLLDGMTGVLSANPLDLDHVWQAAETLRIHLRRHEQCEEECLFPLIEGMGPVQLVHQEHLRLHDLMAAMDAAMETASTAPDEASGADLKRTVEAVAYCLSGHFMKEERLVFPMAAAMLTPEQLTEAGRSMAAIS